MSNELPGQRLWLLMLAAILAVVLLVDLPGGRRWLEVLQDAGHVPAFALATLCVTRLRGGAATWPRLLIAAAVAVVLGALVEIAQFFLQRDASLGDLGRDACGALAAVALLRLVATPAAQWRPRLPALWLASAALTLAALPLIECARAYAHRRAQFPVLADFTSPLDLYFLRPVDPPFQRLCLQASAGGAPRCPRWAVYAPYDASTWAGPVFEELPPDWRGWRELCIELSNPNAGAFTLVVALQDRRYSGLRSDRYTGLWSIAPQSTRVLCRPLAALRVTPGGRLLDLGHIARLAIAQDDAGHQPGFRLHRVWLRPALAPPQADAMVRRP